MCDMTPSHVWNDSFICVTWLIHICDMTHSYVWLTHSYVWRDSFIRVTWLIHICDVASIHMCDSTYTSVRHLWSISHIRTHKHIHTHTHTHIYIYKYRHIVGPSMYMCVNRYLARRVELISKFDIYPIFIYIDTYIFIYIHVYKHIHVYTYIHTSREGLNSLANLIYLIYSYI